jgi:uncharacterized protein YecT (DUF1311 family)
LIRRAAFLLAFVCGPAAAQTQVELTSRAADALTAAEVRMKGVYDGLAVKYGDDSRERLEKAQDAWEQYRDRQCVFENKGTEGGTIHQMLLYKCLKSQTDRRIAELRRQENCEEGDLSCVRD